MTGVAVKANTAGRGGGIDSRATLNMFQSEISGNIETQVGNAGTMDSGGGGLLVVQGATTLENVTVPGNTSAGVDGGGGIYVSCGTPCGSTRQSDGHAAVRDAVK